MRKHVYLTSTKRREGKTDLKLISLFKKLGFEIVLNMQKFKETVVLNERDENQT